MLRWLAILSTLFILAIIVMADEGLLDPFRHIYDFQYGDKAGHFILYGLLTLFINLYFLSRPHRNSTKLVLIVSLTLAVLIGLEEWSQSRFPMRTMDIVDLSASYAGVTVSAIAARRIKNRTGACPS
jgi:VanZ family protein